MLFQDRVEMGFGYNPLGQLQVTWKPEEEVVDKMYNKGETPPPACLEQADN